MTKFFAGILLGIVLMVVPFGGRGQVSITSTGTAYTQNFDAMGSSGSASLPTGFKIGNDWATATAVTTLAYGTTGIGAVTSGSTGGAINWADGITSSSTDRGIGFLSTGTYTSPRSLIYAFTNNTGGTVASLDINFSYEKYRSGSRAFEWTFFHGNSGAAINASIAGDHSYPADADNSVISNPPLSFSKSLTIGGLSIANGTTYYLRWTYTGSGGSTNSQGLGIDNFSITCNTAGYAIAVTQATGGIISPGTTHVTPGDAQSFTATANPCYDFTNWIVDGSNAGIVNPYTFSNVSTSHTITAVYASIAPEAPTALPATDVVSSSLTANWTAVAGAIGYYVDVYTNSPLASDLIFSEYVEGSSNNKYIEIFNGTGSSINLSDYRLELYSNGSVTASASLNLTGALVTNAVAVYKNTSATLYAGSATSNGTVMLFNGNDAVALRKISTNTLVDIIGRIGEDPGSAWVAGINRTEDKTLVRKSGIASGVSVNPSSGFPTLGTEWDQFNIDDVSHLGSHVFSGGLVYVPGFQNIFVTTNSIDVTGLTAGTSYYYVVRAFNGTCSSPNSNIMAVPGAGACSATTSVTSFLPATGPLGTMVTIRGTGFSTTPTNNGVKFGEIFSPYYTRQGDTIIVAGVPVGASASSVIRVVNATTCWGSSSAPFSLISTTGSCTMTDIIISEVFDPVSGNNHYIEVFNGTPGTINLNSPNNYTMQVWNDPNSTNTFDISGSIAPGQVKVYYAGTNGGLATAPAQGAGVGFNQDDEIRLLKNGTLIDRMIAPGNTGYNWRRRSSVAGPSVTYTASEWILKEETDVNLVTTDIGTFTAGADLDFTTHPVDQTCNFSMNAVGTGAITAYQWMFFDPSDSTWKNVNLANLPGTVQPGGAQTSSLTITGNIAPYINYQFYLEIRNGSSCSRASNAARFEYLTKAYYKANVALGDWTTPGSWLMSDNINSGYGATCTYPVASNSEAVIIPSGTKINHSTNLSISIDKLSIESGGELEVGSAAGLKMLNSFAGEDLHVDGTLLDRTGSGAGNGISFEDNTGTVNDASWRLGAYATIVKTNSSGASNYRDFYETGISNIPATAQWTYRHDNLTSSIGFASSTTTTSMIYPNLTLENTVSGNTYSSGFNSTAPNLSSFTMMGANNPVIIKGNFDIGGSGTGFINFLNINSSAAVRVEGNMTVKQGNTLSNFGNATSVGTGFELKGNLTIDGTFTNNGGPTNHGMLRFSGTIPQIISGSGTMNFEDVDINNLNGAVVTVNKNFDIPGTISFGSSTAKLSFGTGSITLKSSISRTANVGIIPTGAVIAYPGEGRFVVERYINTGIGHQRSWQFLATPTTGQTIKNSWQEGGNNSISGYGTQVTGPVVANGIDSYTINPALKTFNNTTGLWDGISNTESTPVNNMKGYMLFVRGDRTSVVTPTYQPPAVPTVLRTAGTIYQPSQPPPGFTGANSLGPDQWQSVGNPYASPISLVNMFGSTSYWNNIYKAVSVWDPSIYGANAVGGYQAISATNLYKPVPGGSTIYDNAIPVENIQSGQAFFVQALPTGGTISFAEAVKSDIHALVNFAPANPAGPSAFFRTTLYDVAGNITDGNVVAYNRRYSNNILGEDAPKVYNSGDNFGILSHNRWLAVEGREHLKEQDTIQFGMYNLRAQQTYRLGFSTENMRQPNVHAWLVDRYLGTRTLVSLTDSSFVSFSINAETKSKNHDRFYVVLLPKKVPAPKTVQHLAPVQDVSWSGTIIEGENGGIISVYPNPVSGRQLNVQLNEFIPGIYSIQLFNAQGRKVYQYTITIESKSVNKTIKLPPGFVAGNYRLQLKNDNSTKNVNVIIQ